MPDGSRAGPTRSMRTYAYCVQKGTRFSDPVVEFLREFGDLNGRLPTCSGHRLGGQLRGKRKGGRSGPVRLPMGDRLQPPGWQQVPDTGGRGCPRLPDPYDGPIGQGLGVTTPSSLSSAGPATRPSKLFVREPHSPRCHSSETSDHWLFMGWPVGPLGDWNIRANTWSLWRAYRFISPKPAARHDSVRHSRLLNTCLWSAYSRSARAGLPGQ